jgi:hypothetical protein
MLDGKGYSLGEVISVKICGEDFEGNHHHLYYGSFRFQ